MELKSPVPTNVGQEIARLRADISATQMQLASKSGVDQSRVSRIEKGEIGTPSELGKILDALSALGSKGAADFAAYLAREWRYIERPDFTNPQPTVKLGGSGPRRIRAVVVRLLTGLILRC